MNDYKNPAAVALGRMGKGKPKTVSDEDREARRLRMVALNTSREKLRKERSNRKADSKQAVKDRAAAGLPAYADTQAMVRGILVDAVQSWLVQQRDEDRVEVGDAYNAASAATRTQVRSLLGLP